MAAGHAEGGDNARCLKELLSAALRTPGEHSALGFRADFPEYMGHIGEIRSISASLGMAPCIASGYSLRDFDFVFVTMKHDERIKFSEYGRIVSGRQKYILPVFNEELWRAGKAVSVFEYHNQFTATRKLGQQPRFGQFEITTQGQTFAAGCVCRIQAFMDMTVVVMRQRIRLFRLRHRKPFDFYLKVL